jgi:hypothetical protein
VPRGVPIQVIGMAGMPDPATMTFDDGHVRADLHDLGRDAGAYAPVPRRRVAEVLKRQPGPGGRPRQGATS